ncbi:MAG: DUF805 domain-containing protein [Mangrovibacterium sp.]
MKSFQLYFLSVLRNNYANFTGRASLKQYWMFVLYLFVAFLLAALLDNLLGLTFSEVAPYGWIYSSLGLFTTIPQLGLLVRRLHDVGKSGWYYFIVCIPLVGAILLVVALAKKGDAEENKYGAAPIEEVAER